MKRKKSEKSNIAEEQLNRISSEFELDMLRLIKTRSMLSTTSEIISEHSRTAREGLNELQSELNEFNSRLLDITKGIATKYDDPSLQGSLNDILTSVEDCRNRTRKVKNELDKQIETNLAKLDSLNSFYGMELQAFQQELDTRIRELRAALTNEITVAGNSQDDRYVKPFAETKAKTAEYVPKDHKSDTVGKTGVLGINYLFFPRRYIAATILIFLALLVYIYQTLYLPSGMDERAVDVNISDEPASSVVAGSGDSSIETGTQQGTEGVEIPSGSIKTPDEMLLQADTTPELGGQDNTASEISEHKALYSVIARGANIRSGPGTGYQVLSVVRKGEVLESSDGETERWIKVITGQGQEGWIAKGLIREVNN